MQEIKRLNPTHSHVEPPIASIEASKIAFRFTWGKQHVGCLPVWIPSRLQCDKAL